MDNTQPDKQTFNFLTEIYEVIKCFENNPAKLSGKINELKTKFERARTLLGNMPGIDMSQREQEDYYIGLLKQYEKENELLNSYKEMCKFDITKLDQPIPDDFKSVAVASAATSSSKVAVKSECDEDINKQVTATALNEVVGNSTASSAENRQQNGGGGDKKQQQQQAGKDDELMDYEMMRRSDSEMIKDHQK